MTHAGSSNPALEPEAEAGTMEPILTKYVREPNSYTLDFSLKHQGVRGPEEGARR